MASKKKRVTTIHDRVYEALRSRFWTTGADFRVDVGERAFGRLIGLEPNEGIVDPTVDFDPPTTYNVFNWIENPLLDGWPDDDNDLIDLRELGVVMTELTSPRSVHGDKTILDCYIYNDGSLLGNATVFLTGLVPGDGEAGWIVGVSVDSATIHVNELDDWLSVDMRARQGIIDLVLDDEDANQWTNVLQLQRPALPASATWREQLTPAMSASWRERLLTPATLIRETIDPALSLPLGGQAPARDTMFPGTWNTDIPADRFLADWLLLQEGLALDEIHDVVQAHKSDPIACLMTLGLLTMPRENPGRRRRRVR